MFKNLTAGQWTVFVLLTCCTFFGGFLYLAAEAYFSRKDRDFAATPAGAAHLAQIEQEAADKTARNDVRHGLTMQTKGGFWNREVSLPKALFILGGIILGVLPILNASLGNHPTQAGPSVAQASEPVKVEARERCRPKTAEEQQAYLSLKRMRAEGTLTGSERVAANIALYNYELDLRFC